MDFSEKWGDSIDEAVKLALEDLKLTRDEVTVTVLEEPSRGFLGIIGQKLAKVRVEKKKSEETKQVSPQKAVSEPEAVSESLSEEKNVKEKNTEKSEKKERRSREKKEKPAKMESKLVLRVRPDDLAEVTDHAALTFLKEVTEKMGLALTMKCYVDDENVFIDMEGKDSGTIIGKRGQTLDAIQYLTSLVVNKDSEKYLRVVVDAENYRAKRERTLEQLANRLADKVINTGKNVRLEPMNPYERKVIHATLQNRSEVITRSEGEEPYRRIVIERK